MDESRETYVAAILARGLLRLRHCAERPGRAASSIPRETHAPAEGKSGREQRPAPAAGRQGGTE